MKKIIMLVLAILISTSRAHSFNEAPVPSKNIKSYSVDYSKNSKNTKIIESLKIMENSPANLSYNKIMGNNPTRKNIKIIFKDLTIFNYKYKDFDGLGWERGKRLYIYLSPKNNDAPKESLCALISGIAIHDDKYDSINEEITAMMVEASTWDYFVEKKPELQYFNHPLVNRENAIRKVYLEGNKTDKCIRKVVESNYYYKTLQKTSPGFGY